MEQPCGVIPGQARDGSFKQDIAHMSKTEFDPTYLLEQISIGDRSRRWLLGSGTGACDALTCQGQKFQAKHRKQRSIQFLTPYFSKTSVLRDNSWVAGAELAITPGITPGTGACNVLTCQGQKFQARHRPQVRNQKSSYLHLGRRLLKKISISVLGTRTGDNFCRSGTRAGDYTCIRPGAGALQCPNCQGQKFQARHCPFAQNRSRSMHLCLG